MAGIKGCRKEMMKMHNTKDKLIWVAVRVQRGFVSDIRAYADESLARQRESLWRRQMNPDYDETAVSFVRVRSQKPDPDRTKTNRGRP